MATHQEENDVIIIGGGMSGLVLAQGLKHRNVPFKLFERDPAVSTKGYRFRLVDDGVDALEKTLPPAVWALLEQTHPESKPPNFLIVDAQSGKQTKYLPSPQKRSYPIDRPWIQQLLHLGIEEKVQFGKIFERYELLPSGKVRVHFQDNTTATGRILVAADGVRSSVRKQMLPHVKLLNLDRMIMWGRTPLSAEFEKQFGHPDVLSEHFSTMIDYQDPRRSCLFAPIRWPLQGQLSQAAPSLTDQPDYVFWALCFETPPPSVSLATLDDRKAYALQIASNWDRGFRKIFELQSSSSSIPVHSNTPDVPVWPSDDRITFMGDAIHTMSPTGGAGGLMATLDAAQLCDVLSGSWNGEVGEWAGLKEVLAKYEQDMRERAGPAIAVAFANAKMLWAGEDWQFYSPAN
ncbi:FAD/NAD(P)-binding domain-containing protein [Thozetella sp. PMI_491]|nr:FAD/NAD(P)-binding domain-containing protein [Thozetella sp. PMI_491]